MTQHYFPNTPMIISEVGIPTSLGTSHSGYSNRWHGHMTEQRQAEILIEVVGFMVTYGTRGHFWRGARLIERGVGPAWPLAGRCTHGSIDRAPRRALGPMHARPESASWPRGPVLQLTLSPCDARMAGFTGVFLFELMDEWFKKNWNTLDVDVNRKAWHNTLSSEQYYGLLATEVRACTTPSELGPERTQPRQ